MKQLLAVCLVLLFAVSAFAGDNPNVYAYISFDPAGDEAQTSVTPTAFTTVNAYVCLGNVVGGVTAVSFAINDVVTQCGGVVATEAFTNLLPGNLAIGDAFVGGITLASTECMAGPVVVVGSVDMFYLGGSCCVEILDHVDYPRWVVDCNEPGLVDYYCLKYHGLIEDGVTTPECLTPTEFPCEGSPVEDATWGGIKALYR
jgi:hypothetical protein